MPALFPRAALPLVPAFDRLSRNWLERSRSPYVAEIADIAAALDLSGVWLLNASMQWGCTALAGEEDGEPWLVRTLDWPFKGLGHNTELAHMRGDSGDFFSVTWPGYVGVLTAMAPQRFAACLNQAPMWRRTRHPRLRPFDFTANAVGVWSTRRLHAAGSAAAPGVRGLRGLCRGAAHAGNDASLARGDLHLGRLQARTSAASSSAPRPASSRANRRPAPPTIGCRRRPGWEGRIGMRRFLVCSFADAAAISRARRETLAGFEGSFAGARFDWLRPPVLNPYTRLAAAMSPARGILRATGYDVAGAELPVPVTQTCEIEVAPRQAA